MNKFDFNGLKGMVIEFNKNVENLESGFELGMKARIVKIQQLNHDVVIIGCDFSEYESENERLMTANYFDNNGKPCLRWKDTSSYPKNKIADIYIGEDTDKFPLPFNVIGKMPPTVNELLEQIAKLTAENDECKRLILYLAAKAYISPN